MKYITAFMFLLSFAHVYLMTMDLLTHGNHWGILEVMLYGTLTAMTFVTGFATISLNRIDKLDRRNRRNRRG